MQSSFGVNCSLGSSTFFSPKLAAGEGLTKRPIQRSNIVGDDVAAIAGGDLERKGLAVEIQAAFPILPPISWHGLPPGSWTLDSHRMNVAGATDVGDEYQVEVGVAINGEPYASTSPTCHPAKIDCLFM